jgi:hypothetical protein
MADLILLVNDIPDHANVYEQALVGSGFWSPKPGTGADQLYAALLVRLCSAPDGS